MASQMSGQPPQKLRVSTGATQPRDKFVTTFTGQERRLYSLPGSWTFPISGPGAGALRWLLNVVQQPY